MGTHRSELTYDGHSRRTRIVEKENGATVRDAQLFWDGTAIVEKRLTTGEVNRFFSDGEQHNGAARLDELLGQRRQPEQRRDPADRARFVRCLLRESDPRVILVDG